MKLPESAQKIHDSLPEDIRARIDKFNEVTAPDYAGKMPDAGIGAYIVDRLQEEGLAHSHRSLAGLFTGHRGFLVRHPETGKYGWHVPRFLAPSDPTDAEAVYHGPGTASGTVYRHSGVGPNDTDTHYVLLSEPFRGGYHEPGTFDQHIDHVTGEMVRHAPVRHSLTEADAHRIARTWAWRDHNDNAERLARKKGDTSFGAGGGKAAETSRQLAGQTGNVPARQVAAEIGRGRAKGVVPVGQLIDPAAAVAARKKPTKRPYILPDALATAGVESPQPADLRHNPDLDDAFADPSAPAATTPADLRHNPDLDDAFGMTSAPAPVAHPWLARTRLGSHMAELAAHHDARVSGLARAVLEQTDPNAAGLLGRALKQYDPTHRLADAYNWDSLQRNLDGDRKLHDHLTRAGQGRGLTAEDFARNIERLGDRHSALDKLAAVHGTSRQEVLRAAKRIVDRYADHRAMVDPHTYPGARHDTGDTYLSYLSGDEHMRLSREAMTDFAKQINDGDDSRRHLLYDVLQEMGAPADHAVAVHTPGPGEIQMHPSGYPVWVPHQLHPTTAVRQSDPNCPEVAFIAHPSETLSASVYPHSFGGKYFVLRRVRSRGPFMNLHGHPYSTAIPAEDAHADLTLDDAIKVAHEHVWGPEHTRNSRLGTLAHGLAVAATTGLGHFIGSMTGVDKGGEVGAALGVLPGMGFIGRAARAVGDAVSDSIAERRKRKAERLPDWAEKAAGEVELRGDSTPLHDPPKAHHRASLSMALKEAGHDPLAANDPAVYKAWLGVTHGLGRIDSVTALDRAARDRAVAKLRGMGLVQVKRNPPRVYGTNPPGKPAVPYTRIVGKPPLSLADLGGPGAGRRVDDRKRKGGGRKKKGGGTPNLFAGLE